MDNKPDETIDEKPKALIAQNVVAAKRKYFLPTHGVTIEADSPDEAVKIHKDNLKEKAGNE